MRPEVHAHFRKVPIRLTLKEGCNPKLRFIYEFWESANYIFSVPKHTKFLKKVRDIGLPPSCTIFHFMFVLTPLEIASSSRKGLGKSARHRIASGMTARTALQPAAPLKSASATAWVGD